MTRTASKPAVPPLVIEQVLIDDLHPDPANPRRIADADLEALTRSIREFGLVDPILARLADRTVIGGHQRLLAARRLGLKEVPVIYLDLTAEKARLLNVGLNKIGGDFDQELLGRLLADLSQTPDVDLTLTGFDEKEIAELLRSLDVREKRERPETFDLDAALEEANRSQRVNVGDIWQLGEHRLLCGDATKPDDVARLLQGAQPQMAFTDPPYNVSFGASVNPRHRRRSITNDSLTAEEWEIFCQGWAENLLASVSGALYICMSCKEWATVSRILAKAGGHWSDTIIWEKDRFVLGRADYQHGYEPVWYGWKEGQKRTWCGDRDQSDVWRIARPSDSPLHPTMKPLALIERAIENSSANGDLVLDLFLGSGSTVIAAERTGRVCYGMELDPHYCSIVVARWEAFTGRDAEKVKEQ